MEAKREGWVSRMGFVFSTVLESMFSYLRTYELLCLGRRALFEDEN